MKFKRDKSKERLEDQLEMDLRSQLLRDKSLIVIPTHPSIPNTDIIYNGPFYCESAGDSGSITCTDCNIIVSEELKALDESGVFFCYLDDRFSAGTIVELMYCAMKKVPTYIVYKKKETKYKVESEYWFAIVAATQLNPKTYVKGIDRDLDYYTLREIIKSIDKNLEWVTLYERKTTVDKGEM